MKSQKNSRREFLATATGMAGASWMALNAPVLMAAAEAATAQLASGSEWTTITAKEAEALAAVVDQIIPPDETPGAAELGVVNFIDQALNGFRSGNLGMIREGLAALDARAVETFAGSTGFAALTFEQQTGLLQQIEDSPFFGTMIFLTHCGLFAMPSWGGNRNKGGWALIGFDDRFAWQPPFGYYDAQADAGENSDGV